MDIVDLPGTEPQTSSLLPDGESGEENIQLAVILIIVQLIITILLGAFVFYQFVRVRNRKEIILMMQDAGKFHQQDEVHDPLNLTHQFRIQYFHQKGIRDQKIVTYEENYTNFIIEATKPEDFQGDNPDTVWFRDSLKRARKFVRKLNNPPIADESDPMTEAEYKKRYEGIGIMLTSPSHKKHPKLWTVTRRHLAEQFETNHKSKRKVETIDVENLIPVVAETEVESGVSDDDRTEYAVEDKLLNHYAEIILRLYMLLDGDIGELKKRKFVNDFFIDMQQHPQYNEVIAAMDSIIEEITSLVVDSGELRAVMKAIYLKTIKLADNIAVKRRVSYVSDSDRGSEGYSYRSKPWKYEDDPPRSRRSNEQSTGGDSVSRASRASKSKSRISDFDSRSKRKSTISKGHRRSTVDDIQEEDAASMLVEHGMVEADGKSSARYSSNKKKDKKQVTASKRKPVLKKTSTGKKDGKIRIDPKYAKSAKSTKSTKSKTKSKPAITLRSAR